MSDDWSLDDLRAERFHIAHLISDLEGGALPPSPEWLADLKRELPELDARIAAVEAKTDA